MMRNQRRLIIILCCLVPLWGWAIAQQFFTGKENIADVHNKPSTHTASKIKIVNLNPPIAQSQPDLNEGYLFNAERFLKSTESTDDQAQAINMETIQYDGSIIVGDTHKALISFEIGKPVNRAKRNTPQKRTRTLATTSTRQSKIITVDDKVAGYMVESIEPLVITFKRGTEKIKKELFAKEKSRTKTSRVKKNIPPIRKRTALKKPVTKSKQKKVLIPLKRGIHRK